MEPYPKRQKLYAPSSRLVSQSFDDQHAYRDELGHDMPEDLEEYDDDDEDASSGVGYDPEAELHQKRARLDDKLKSKFESIFEKYERNFDGVGDEIDMETGEIVVNNGHLMQMMGEQDVGAEHVARHATREYTEGSDELPSSSIDETEMMDAEDEEEDDEDETSEDLMDDMEEDDMILRGFAKANRFQQVEMSNAPPRPKVRRQDPTPRPAANKQLPSRADILAQFGPQLGPQIVEYVSKKHVQEDDPVETPLRASAQPSKVPVARKIEPAWRAPALPSAGPSQQPESVWRVPDLASSAFVRRPAKNRTATAPAETRSPSPEASRSIWAPIRTRARRRLNAENNALFREDSGIPDHTYKPLLYSQQNRILIEEVGLSSPRKKWTAFTAEEDDMMLHWVSKTQKQGFPLTMGRWREFQAEHPQHSASSWRQRYTTKYTYLATNQVEGSVVSNPEISAKNMGNQPLPSTSHKQPEYGVGPAPRQHPARDRKPAQTDPRILSWSEAVDSIETLDPVLHAGILHDARNLNGNERYVQPSSTRQDVRGVEEEPDSPAEFQEITPPEDDSCSSADAQNSSSLAVEPTPEQEDALIPCAPCPHADCILLPNILYKLQRRENEDVSEICLHLFRVHHTTPFPCGEIGCPKTGEDGFFLQVDLIKHVRVRHKTISSLQRLRGRVDPALLEQQMKLASNHQSEDNSPPGMCANRLRDSDFMSPQQQHQRHISSSQALSGFEPDQTVTPRVAGRSTFTPRTSVSSLKVHHPSATSTAAREEICFQDREILDSQADYSSRDEKMSPPIIDEEPVTRRSGDSFQRPTSALPDGESPDMRAKAAGSTRNPDPQRPRTSAGSSAAHPPSFARPRRTSLGSLPDVGVQEKVNLVASPLIPKNLAKSSSLSTNVNLQASAEGSLTPFASSAIQVVVKHSPVVQTLTRNKVDAAYDFSDEEMAALTPVIVAAVQPVAEPTPRNCMKARATASMGNTSVGGKSGVKLLGKLPTVTPKNSTVIRRRDETGLKTRKKAKPPLATPAAKTRYRRAHSEGIDELSMGVEDFILLSAQTMTNPLPNLQMGIKHEEAADSPWRSVPAARKRKLDAYQGNKTNDLDSAVASRGISSTEGASSTSTTQPTIKTETDDIPLSVTHLMLSKRRGRPPKPKTTGLGESSRTSPVPPLSLPMAIRTSTPLLDLTPVRNRRANAERIKAIGDSDGEASPDLDSPSERLKHLPPVGGGSWNSDVLKAEGVAVLVKTPGGTMRRCGVEDFACGRSFCFRCSK
ncbi:centromere protein Scm3 [Diplocarpon rosae]|nr:centromere protein Scm3 [Diplocarpon rosae]